MTPQEHAKKVMTEEIAKAGLDEQEQVLLLEYVTDLTGLALALMQEDAEDGVDKHKPLRAMISACKVCLYGLEQQRMDFAGGDLTD